MSLDNSIGYYKQQLQLAQQHIQKGDYISAENFFRSAIRVKKNSAVALAGLGQCLCLLKRSKEGVVFLTKAGQVLQKKAKKTGDSKDLLNLAYQLIHWHAPEESLALARVGLAIEKNSANANYIVALGLQGLNRLSEACKFAGQAVDIAAHESNAVILLATLEAKTGELAKAKERLVSIINKPVDINRARALLELATILDKLGEYSQAFDCLKEAGEINLNSDAVKNLNENAVYRDIEQYKAGFDADFLRSAADRVIEDGLPNPVFLLGFYRSGTTLAEQVLATHPDVITSDEAYLIPQLLGELKKITTSKVSLPERIKTLTSDEIKHLRGFYWKIAKDSLGNNVIHQVLVDKTAMNTLSLELINTLFPSAVVIFAVRDPRDVCLSCFMQPFTLSPLTMHFLSWQGTARFYALIMDYWLLIRRDLSVRWVELRYEDVVDDLESQFRPVFKMMGLQWTDECAKFYRHSKNRLIKTPSFSQVTQPLYKTSSQRWRNYQRHYDLVASELERYVQLFRYDL